MINNHMQTRDGEAKNDLEELMYVRLFTRRFEHATVCSKQSRRPTDARADNFFKVCFGSQQNVAHLNLAANKAPPVRSANCVNVFFFPLA